MLDMYLSFVRVMPVTTPKLLLKLTAGAYGTTLSKDKCYLI